MAKKSEVETALNETFKAIYKKQELVTATDVQTKDNPKRFKKWSDNRLKKQGMLALDENLVTDLYGNKV